MAASQTADTRRIVREYVHKHVGDQVSDTDDLFAASLVSSLFAVQTVMWVERQFNIAVAGDELNIENFCSIDRICEFADRISRRRLPARRRP